MKRFMALYMAERSALETMMKAPPEEMKGAMEAWTAWLKAHESDIAEVGSPLGKTKRIDAKGMADARNDITGYTIVESESFEAASKVLAGNPHLQMPGCTIELMEIMPLPAM